MRKGHEQVAPGSSQFVSAASLRVRLDWFNKLRWGAAVGVLLAVMVTGVWLRIPLPLGPLLSTGGVLLLLNLLYVIRNRRLAPVDISAEIRLVKLQMLGDLVALTVLLNLSGGIENPALFLYLIHVIIASLLFKGREIFQIAWLAIFLFTGEVMAEYFGWLPHHHLLSASEMTHELPFILMTLASFCLVLLFSAYMGASIMSHNRAIKDELVLRQQDLVEADKARMDFFRFVTHEVKSPVSTAQSAVETALELGGDTMSPQVEDMLSRSVGRLQQASRIVRDLADLTRSGMLKQEFLRVVDLSAMLTRVVANQSDMAGRTGQTVQLDLPPKPIVMTSNGSMVEKIMENLVSNAVRYNRPEGRVRVTLADRRASVWLEVVDEGIGIAVEDQDRIFEEFYRSVAAQEATNLGTGLGLAIVRKFVAELGGEVDLVSAPGSGATFSVTLPRHPKGRAAKS